MKPLGAALKGFEQKLRYRHMVGGDRLPVGLTKRLASLIQTLEGERYFEDDLASLFEEIQGCCLCGLHQYRRNIVYGEGNDKARLVFVGEGPGEEEDIQGRPFVGPAGQLLTRIIKAMGLQRQEVYIANVVKCRPPGNRIPNSDEIESCRRFLEGQLRAISPQVICTLGAVAAQTLLKTGNRISQLRGRLHQWEGIMVMPTYHPSYLLRNPEKKREVWDDVKRVMQILR